jgi:hypothetical protein
MYISVSEPSEIAVFVCAEISTLEGMVELCLTKNFSPAIFKDGKRNLKNFERAYCIGMDIDNDGKLYKGQPTPLMTLEEAKKSFADYTHLILPSRSHQIEKDGVAVDRYRVILFFSEPITDVDTFYATWDWCKKRWPAIDHQCKDPSRFYYKHSDVASVRAFGLRVTPVAPTPKDPLDIDSIDLTMLPPNSRGKLSKASQDWLSNGIPKGNRNGDTFKIAKEYQQNLYTFDEAVSQIVPALRDTDTIARDFTEEEVISTIRSAYNSEAKHDPRIKPNAFNLVPIGEVYKTKAKVEWLVEDLLAVGGISLLASEPKAGKSALIRQLIRDVLRGSPFLDRKVKQGNAIYLALEEQIEVVNESFQKLGINEADQLSVHVGEPLHETVTEDFREMVMTNRPAIVVVDTLFDLIDAEENNYKEVKQAMRELRKIARASGSHIALVHHSGKGDSNPKYRTRGQRAILGSTAISGGVDTILMMSVDGNKRELMATGRGVRRFRNCILTFDKRDDTYSLGPEQDEF